jgi:hypothetical protein
MAKGTDLGSAGPDHPVYKSGLTVNSVPGLRSSTGTSRKSTAGGAPQSAEPSPPSNLEADRQDSSGEHEPPSSPSTSKGHPSK